jgi:hypothetical protein
MNLNDGKKYMSSRFEVFTAVNRKMHSSVVQNPVGTSQDKHYVSTTEISQLMIRKILGFHDGDYEECRLLGCGAVFLL